MEIIIFLIFFSLLGWVEVLVKPRLVYVRESSVFVFYFFAAKNKRKRIVFKI